MRASTKIPTTLVPCPRCGATVGHLCRMAGGKDCFTSHAARKVAFKAFMKLKKGVY